MEDDLQARAAEVRATGERRVFEGVALVPLEDLRSLQRHQQQRLPAWWPWAVVGVAVVFVLTFATTSIGDAFTGGGMFAAVAAVLLQRNELALQREELSATREEMRKQREASEDSAMVAKKRQSLDREALAVERLNAALQLQQVSNRGDFHLRKKERLTQLGSMVLAARVPEVSDLQRYPAWRSDRTRVGEHGELASVRRHEAGYSWTIEYKGSVVDSGKHERVDLAVSAADEALARASSRAEPYPVSGTTRGQG